uniref:MENTAL domain-containing protein n=1 Tax=Anas platyrhynchos platyrhynchos TaxID=8840 RepID=A0A493TG69_ANAPP
MSKPPELQHDLERSLPAIASISTSLSHSQAFSPYGFFSPEKRKAISDVRRTFCLFVTFDLLFISLLWIIELNVSGGQKKKHARSFSSPPGGVANLPLPAQLLGTDKKSFELWSLPLISAWGRPRCCPPASKAPPGFCPPAVARPLDSQLIFFLPAPAAQSRSRGRAFFFFFLSRPVPTSWGRAGHWVSGCRLCMSCEMKR